MDKRKKYILVFDTETAPIKPSSVCDSSNSLVYDFGCGVYDKKGNCYETRSFVNRDIFLDEFEKMQSAYYCKKIPIYINDLANGTRLLRTTEEIQMEIAELIEKYNKTANEIFENRIPTNYEEIRNALDQNREKFFDELANI
jgi:hypothetical protein